MRFPIDSKATAVHFIFSDAAVHKRLANHTPSASRPATWAGSEIFNPRIVPDSLIFISVVAARWPGPPGELNLRGCEPPAYSHGLLKPWYSPPASASEWAKSERVGYSSRWRMQVKRRMQQTDEAMTCLLVVDKSSPHLSYSDFLFSILFCSRKCEINVIILTIWLLYETIED